MLNLIVVIDDDPINNMICEKLLKLSGITREIRCFLVVSEALDWLFKLPAAERPELIFLDINMPVIDSWGFLDRLQEQMPGHGIRVSILTSSISLDDKAQAATYPAITDFLAKPLSLEKIRQLVIS
jgi:CheY-like chemotaxis protein